MSLTPPSQPPPATASAPTPRVSETRLLMGIVGISVATMGLLATTGHFGFVWKTALIPLLLVTALLSRRTASFVRDWSLFLACVVLFDSMRGLVYSLITAFDLPWYANYVIQMDRAVLGGVTLPELMQGASRGELHIGAFEKFLVVVHGSHFLFFLLFGLAFWLLRREHFATFRTAFLLLLAGGLLGYALVPTAPPWMSSRDLQLLPAIHHVTPLLYNMAVPTLQKAFDVNPIAAMPSLHTAFPTLCTLLGLHYFGRRAAFMVLYTLSVYVAIGYLGEHYIVDIFAGILLAVLAYAGARYLSRRQAASASPEVEVSERLRWDAPTRRHVLGAFAVLLAAQLAGQTGESLRQPLRLTRAFVERELVGRSPRAQLLLGHAAMEEGDAAGAAKAFGLALAEVRSEEDRTRALDLLTRLAFETKEPSFLSVPLARLEPKQRGLKGGILLAQAQQAEGHGDLALEELGRLMREHPKAVEPGFWHAYYRVLAGQLSGTALEAEAVRLDARNPQAGRRLRELAATALADSGSQASGAGAP